MLSPGNVATIGSAATAARAESAALAGSSRCATDPLLAQPAALFRCPSSDVTCTAGVIAAPAAVLVGCTVKLSCVAAPAVMLNGVQVVPLTLAPFAVSV